MARAATLPRQQQILRMETRKDDVERAEEEVIESREVLQVRMTQHIFLESVHLHFQDLIMNKWIKCRLKKH